MSEDDDPQRPASDAESGPREVTAASGGSEGAESEDARPQRFRRRLLGARPADVSAALASRDHEIDELRRDVAGLWLAFGQHERTIYELLATVERLAGVGSLEPPPPAPQRPTPAAAPPAAAEPPPATDPPPPTGEASHPPEPPPALPTPPSASTSAPGARGAEPGSRASRPDRPPLAASITDQLSDLDEVLAAIEQATNSLEQTYEERIAEGEGDEHSDQARGGSSRDGGGAGRGAGEAG